MNDLTTLCKTCHDLFTEHLRINHLRLWNDKDTSSEIIEAQAAERELAATGKEFVKKLLDRMYRKEITEAEMKAIFREHIEKKRRAFLEDDPWNPEYKPKYRKYKS